MKIHDQIQFLVWLSCFGLIIANGTVSPQRLRYRRMGEMFGSDSSQEEMNTKSLLKKRNLLVTANILPIYLKTYNRNLDEINARKRLGDMRQGIGALASTHQMAEDIHCPAGLILLAGGCI